MGEGAVGLSLLVDVVALADGIPLPLGGILELIGQGAVHGLTFTATGKPNDPAHGQGLLTAGGDFEGHLVGGTTHAAGFDFHARLGVFDGAVEELQRIDAVGLLIEGFDGGLDDALSKGLLAIKHDVADERGNEFAVVAAVLANLFVVNAFSAGHGFERLGFKSEGFLLLLGGGCGSTGLRTLGTVFGTATTSGFNAKAVESTADDVVTHTGQVFHTTTADQHDAVFLKIVTFTTDVGDDFVTVGQTNFGHLTKSGVGLLRGASHHLKADAATLRALCKRRRLRLYRLVFAAVSDELIDGGHGVKEL